MLSSVFINLRENAIVAYLMKKICSVILWERRGRMGVGKDSECASSAQTRETLADKSIQWEIRRVQRESRWRFFLQSAVVSS